MWHSLKRSAGSAELEDPSVEILARLGPLHMGAFKTSGALIETPKYCYSLYRDLQKGPLSFGTISRQGIPGSEAPPPPPNDDP